MVGSVHVARNITVHKQMENKLAEYSKHLESLVAERTKQLRDSERLATIGATAGMVGHDIRNPLQAITCDLYLAVTEVESCPKGKCKTSVKESLLEHRLYQQDCCRLARFCQTAQTECFRK